MLQFTVSLQFPLLQFPSDYSISLQFHIVNFVCGATVCSIVNFMCGTTVYSFLCYSFLRTAQSRYSFISSTSCVMLRITVPSLQFPCFLPTQYLDRLVCLQQHGVWLEEALGTTTSLLSLSSGSTHCGAVFAFANCKSLLSLLGLPSCAQRVSSLIRCLALPISLFRLSSAFTLEWARWCCLPAVTRQTHMGDLGARILKQTE